MNEDLGQEPVGADRVVVIGGSAGGLQALIEIVRGLPLDLPAAVCVVLHLPSNGRSFLADILRRLCGHDVAVAEHGEPLLPGTVRVAATARRLVVQDGHLQALLGPRENHHRPAIDPLFRTAARAFGPRVVSVVLSGSLDDGRVGTSVVALRGGTTIAQDPLDPVFPDMPAHANRDRRHPARRARERDRGPDRRSCFGHAIRPTGRVGERARRVT